MVGNTAATATVLSETAVVTQPGAYSYGTVAYTTSSAAFSYDGSGNEQWVKFLLPSASSVYLQFHLDANDSATVALDISMYSSISDTEDGTTLDLATNFNEYSVYAYNSLNQFFEGCQLRNGAQWLFIRIVQEQPIIEAFSLHFISTINGAYTTYGGFDSASGQFFPYGFGYAAPLASTSNFGITSIDPITSTSTVAVKPKTAADDISDAEDISKGGYVTTGVDAAAWNIGTQQPGEVGISAFGLTWVDTTWHKYNLLVAGSVRFYDDPVLADAAPGYGGLTGTLIAVYSGPPDAGYDELTLIDSNLTLNSSQTNYTAADLTVTLTEPTWLYIEHAYVGDLLNTHDTYPDQSMSWSGPAVTKPPDDGGGGGGGTTDTDTDDGLFLLGATMFGGDVGTGTTAATDSVDTALLGDWGFGVTMLGGDTGVDTSTGGGGGGGGTTTGPKLVGKIYGSSMLTANLTLTPPTPRLITFNAEVLSRAGTTIRPPLDDDETAINAQPVHFFT